MPSFGKHRYLVLDDTLSSSEIPNLLGILVVDAANPLSISAPKITEAVVTRLKEYTLEPVSQKNVSDVLKEACSSSLFVCLEKIFNLAASKGR
jgi:acyl-CoA synthetase (NDP forming)